MYSIVGLLDDDRAGHASALMGLTVVGICAGSLEDGLDGLALGVKVVFVAELFSVLSSWDIVLIEHNVVGVTSIIDPCHTLAGLNGYALGIKNKTTVVSAQLDSNCVGREGHAKGGNGDTRSLGNAYEILAK
jgi:hypothetical protein